MAKGTDNGNYSPDIIKGFVDIQKQDQLLREQELQIASAEEKHKYDYACRVVEANKEDRSEARRTGVETLKMVLVFAFAVIFVITACSGIAIWKGHAALVKDIAISLLVFTGGAGAGFAFGYARGRQAKEKNKSGQ